jgi:uncharacterized Tic20 family protein
MTEPTPSSPTEVSKDARTWGMLCHLTALSGFVGVGFGFVLGPLVCWLVKKNDYEFVDDQGKEALNFQITMFIALVVSGVLCIVFIGFVLAPAVVITDVIFTIIGAVKANDGVRYRYPFAWRVIK